MVAFAHCLFSFSGRRPLFCGWRFGLGAFYLRPVLIIMKARIVFDFQKEAGGGKNFLAALKAEWQKQGVYAQNPKEADIILFNSHQLRVRAFWLKFRFSQKVFVHRIDGPISSYRKNQRYVDRAIFQINQLVADGTIFQSQWSQKENKTLFPFKLEYESVILNAPDPSVFNQTGKKPFQASQKTRLIAVSWSQSALKGFDLYRFLDQHLDFSKYEMVFAGQSPQKFQNINILGRLSQNDLASQLKQSDVFISASKIESCSNALIEALSCGLPCLAFRSSSNSEVLQTGGELFSNEQELLEKIEKISQHYDNYAHRLPVFSLAEKAQQYLDFGQKIRQDVEKGLYCPKKISFREIFFFVYSCLIFLITKLIR